jgi:hypothetical protein
MPTGLAIQDLPSLLWVIAAITIPVLLMGTTLALARIEARHPRSRR